MYSIMIKHNFDPKKFKIAAFDLDGTIIHDHQPISDKVQKALVQLKQAGITPVISTGRDPAQLTPDSTENFDYVVGVSGALIVKLHPFEILYGHPFEKDLAVRTAKAVEKYGGDSFLYRNGIIMGSPLSFDLLLRDHTPDQKRLMIALYHNKTFVDVTSASSGVLQSDSPVYKIQSFYRHPETDAPAIAKELSAWDELEIVTMYTGSVEFSPKGVNKGSSLTKLAAHLGCTPEEIIAFGDSENDLEMMKIAGYRVVTGNGTRTMQEMADYVCPPCNEDGVATAISRLFFS